MQSIKLRCDCKENGRYLAVTERMNVGLNYMKLLSSRAVVKLFAAWLGCGDLPFPLSTKLTNVQITLH